MQKEESDSRYLAYIGRVRNIARVGYRYLAFTSDVGEAVRPVARLHLVNACYGISFAYVGADIAYTTAKQHDIDPSLTTRTFLERSLFQGLASLLLPALTIHSIVDLAAVTLKKRNASMFLMRWGPSGVGLAMLPLLPVLLDEPVEWAVETLFHRVWPVNHKNGSKV